MTPTVADQKQLIQKIKQLHSRKLCMELFACIVSTNTPYTQNKNGFFFNLTALSPETFSQVSEILSKHERGPKMAPTARLGSPSPEKDKVGIQKP